MNDTELSMWYAAVATFGVGDILTTRAGLQLANVQENHPVSQEVLGVGGTEGMVAVKVALFLGAYLAWRHSPEEYRIGIPLGLALLGTLVVTNNAAVIDQASEDGL